MPPQKDIEEQTARILQKALPARDRPKNRTGFWALLICIFFLGIGLIVYATSPKASSTDPTGKITQPVTGSRTPRTIVISGQTTNIPPDRPFVVIAVDHKNQALCWPKKPIIHPNTRFLVSFYEGGPVGPVTVSLYAVNHDLHKKIKQWFKEKRLGGMLIFPDRYRLDTVVLEVD